MIPQWDSKSDLPKLIFEEEDLVRAMRIDQLITGKFHCSKCGSDFKCEGWKDIQYYMDLQKMKLELKMVQGIAPINKMVPEEKSQVQIAKWAMFNYLMNLPKNIVEGAQRLRDKLRNDEKNREGISNGEREYDQY